MKTADFFYRLPPELIAQKPACPRDRSRLLIYKSKVKVQKSKKKTKDQGLKTGALEHRHFYDLPDYLQRGDVLVFNDTKVFPARLIGQKESGGKIEALLLEPKTADTWTALLKPGRHALGQTLSFSPDLNAKVAGRAQEIFSLKFNQAGAALDKLIDQLGQTPTPPYIKKFAELREYQTIYAKHRGSVAAPTAGLHFTPGLLAKLKKRGIQFEYVTLHVGLGTFQPVKEAEIERHQIHTEKYSVMPETWERLRAAKQDGRRIIAVGTTTARLLETLGATMTGADLRPPLKGHTNIFITPGYHFKMIDALITNFHLPKSTLLMLVAAFIGDRIKNPRAGIEQTRQIYRTAVQNKYRFYSFGDAILIS